MTYPSFSHKLTLATVLLVGGSGVIFTTPSSVKAAAPPSTKVWTSPAGKLYVQTLTDRVMAAHPELLSVTFHGVPPGAAQKTYTMFGGSYLDRIGNPDDPDDIMVIETGVTILDPRWHRSKDAVRKFVVQTPLRDAAGENIGLIVLAYKNPNKSGKTDKDFLEAGTRIRDDLQKDIPSFAALFEPGK
ncbi:MAG: hypothetical protein JWN43_1304 [Gammaproteobacteria bacterium]|nr:hypothetical protein [Gammaproteobacteria bacterium]